MYQNLLQVKSLFWRYLRRHKKILNIPIPNVFRQLLSAFIPNSISRQISGRSNAYYSVVDTVKSILSAFPSRWPLPIPFFATGLLVAIGIFVNAWVAFDIATDVVANNELFPVDSKCRSTSFDYVIVGAGTAGIIVATRIANASGNLRVLLLEAGGEPSLLNDIPSFDFFLMNQPANTWTYKSPPQKHVCHNCAGRRAVTTRGKMLGGSSSTNFMLYARGNKEDFNRWATEDTFDEEWKYENVLPYFKKSENYNGAYANEISSDIYHGKGGLLNVATHNYMPGAEDFLAAGVEKGYSIGDYNGDEQAVFSKMDVTTQDGWRESVYRAFYQDTGKPPNLCIKKYAHVTKIQFDQNGLDGKPRAVSVTYHRHDYTRTVTASKEIILSAGTFASAKILLLSGVGPSNQLRDLGIPVIKDLPVGKNLQDHAYALVGPFLKGPALNPNKDFSVKSIADVLLNEDGVAAAPAGFAGHAFLQSPLAQPAYPDLQVIQFSTALYPEIRKLLNGILGLKESVLKEWLYPYHLQNSDARLMVILLGRPKSVGQLSLSSTDPNDELIIDPKYLSHPDDREAMLYGFKTIVNLFENTTALNTPLFPKPVPGCKHLKFKSDKYFRCVIRHMSGSFYHHVGTCALGKVVDSRLRVKGIDGLRVIDASVMPRAPNGNTQAATIMIGEKGADFIIYDKVEQDPIEWR